MLVAPIAAGVCGGDLNALMLTDAVLVVTAGEAAKSILFCRDKDIERLVKEAESHRSEDQERRKRVAARDRGASARGTGRRARARRGCGRRA